MTDDRPETSADPHPEDFCGRCGGPNPSWHAASPLWNAVMRTGEREPFDGIVCPSCFAFLAGEAGVTDYICLTAHPKDVRVPLASVFGDGRVWDAAQCHWVAPAPQPEPLRAALERLRPQGEAIYVLWSDIETALQASPPTAQPSPLDVGLPPLTDEQADEGERRLHEAGPFDALSDAESRAVELLRELADEVGRETISGNKRVHMGAWLRARNFLDSLKESGAVPASGEGDE